MTFFEVDLQFLEIEHKFLVSEDFNFYAFDSKLKSLKPNLYKHVDVVDTYFVLESTKGHVYRHRCDEEIQQLSLKSISKDPAVRKEVNLNLSGSSQLSSVRGFLEAGNILFEGSINKSVFVYEFSDVEIVFYRASHKNKIVRCIEIEAKNPDSIESAKAIIESYEQKIGLDSKQREKSSLFDLLLADQLPS